MKLKNYLSIAVAALSLAMFSCSDSDGDGNKGQITFPDASEKTQTLYADQDQASVTFTTKSDWKISVNDNAVYGKAASDLSWVELSETEGSAGTHTVYIYMDKNYSGADRAAVLTISSGGDFTSVKVNQAKTTQSGQTPTPPASQFTKLVSKIESPSRDEEMRFVYDNQNRLTKFSLYEENELYIVMDFAYTSKTVAFSMEQYDEETWKGQVTMTLGSDGYVSSARVDNGGYWSVTYNDGYLSRAVGVFRDYEEDNKKISFTSRATWNGGDMTNVSIEGFDTQIEYSSELNDNRINLDLNWLTMGTEGTDFFLENNNDLFTVLPFAMDLYGKRSTHYRSKLTEIYGTNQYVSNYSVVRDGNNYVTQVRENNQLMYNITYTDPK